MGNNIFLRKRKIENVRLSLVRLVLLSTQPRNGLKDIISGVIIRFKFITIAGR